MLLKRYSNAQQQSNEAKRRRISQNESTGECIGQSIVKRGLERQQHSNEAKRQRIRQRKESTGRFEALDRDLLLDILSRLSPADIILRARRVCKKWRCLTGSEDLRRLSRMRCLKNPWLGGAEPWMVLRASSILFFYDSVQALLDRRGRQLDKRIGPVPGHKFRLVACHLGLVCGRLVDADKSGSHEITLVVGNPLTREWRFLPRVVAKGELVRYTMLVYESGSYYVRILCEDAAFVYNSGSQAWACLPPTSFNLNIDLHFRGYMNSGDMVVRVERSASDHSVFNFTGSNIILRTGKTLSNRSVLMLGVTGIAMAFLPSLAPP